MKDLESSILELIRINSTSLPDDVMKALNIAYEKEEKDSTARSILEVILKNVEESQKRSLPVCQDTGSLIFYVEHDLNYKQKDIKESIERAISVATQKNYLRPNAVDSITGKNSGNNLGIWSPFIFFSQNEDIKGIKIDLMQKGGGSENVGIQYKLPDSKIDAGRDIKGMKKCVIDAIFKAQGHGCAPAGCIGVGIGGDRGTSYLISKKQLFRKLDDRNEDPILFELENELYEKLNTLGIGPMGLGGKTTVLGVKIGKLHRLPACFFVSISYMCWANRRRTLIFKNGVSNYI